MKARMLSKEAMDQLFDHILDGFRSSHEGIKNLEQQGLVSDDDINDLVKKNSERLIDRIKEFKVAQRLVCVFFALLFGYMQIAGEDLEMRRAKRMSRGRRRNETEQTTDLEA